MQQRIILHDRQVDYFLKTSSRARRMRITISYGGEVAVTIPHRFNSTLVEKFLVERAVWILRSIDRLKNTTRPPSKKDSRAIFEKHRTAAQEFVEEKLTLYNQHYNFKYKKVTIKDQRTRWGSCSKAGNLNFNYKVVLLSPRLADYIIVHELCHLRELNHSRNFWNLVARVFPDYKILRQELKAQGLTL